MHNRTIKKSLVVGIIILFIGVSVTPSTGKIETSKTNINEGSLLGYVNDTSGNPIEGALIRVNFHETYEEDYSDSTGFYHVTNIPICYCLKNATCFKECYTTEWVLLSIVENTTHDFILNTTNHPPKAPKITRPGSIPSESVKVIVKNPADYPPGKPIEFRFEAIDPDGDDIRYHIDWGDGYNEITGFYRSSEEVKVNHTYNNQGTYTVTAFAEDTCGFRGPWGTMDIPIWSISTEDNNDLVEITLQLCKTDGVEDHKLFITREQDEQLDILIERFKADLNNAETREETIEIYNDMVVSLDRLGILPERTNCKEVQELVTGENSIYNPEKIKYDKFKNKNTTIFENTNMFCQISGETTNTGAINIGPVLFSIPIIFLGLRGAIILYGIIPLFGEFLGNILGNIYLLSGVIRLAFWLCFFTPPIVSNLVSPLRIASFMSFGDKTQGHPLSDPEYHPARGWVNTNGLNGNKTWEGSIYGNIGRIPTFLGERYLGVVGFTGLQIIGKGFYQGTALWVKLDYSRP